MGPAGMRFKIATGLLALAAAAALAIATNAQAERPVRITVENLDLTFNGGVQPMRISRTKLTPISFAVSGRIDTLDGTQPPALREFVLETDRDGVVDVSGFPSCDGARLQSKLTAGAEAACREAIVGRGAATVEVGFPGQASMVLLKAVARIPAIAGGAGSLRSFSLAIDRRVSRGGRGHGLVSARCDGVLEARGEALFADETKIEGSVFRPCTPVD